MIYIFLNCGKRRLSDLDKTGNIKLNFWILYVISIYACAVSNIRLHLSIFDQKFTDTNAGKDKINLLQYNFVTYYGWPYGSLQLKLNDVNQKPSF